ncbi:YciI family protein [Methylobacterium sp. J-072]|uniref:YciI family protein n=1 Tax=Methylobacterium sp. J-072 TaxID=2836651 RepID=UPI001FBABBDF|nr:YciI family protein [Methylobacterium sp. J-072]MCJ2091504.1 YciI family protein [Methylobacterium sp. J-072]
MPYMIETFDKPGSLDLRKANRAEHLVYLDRIKDRLLACGAKLNDDGSDAGGGLYVVDVDTRAEAEALIQADPFHKVGLFDRVEIKRWRKAYLDGRSYL